MASTKITFEDKVSTITSQLPRKNRITDTDINEIKTAINNNADLLDDTAAAVGVIAPSIAVTSATKTLTIRSFNYCKWKYNLNKRRIYALWRSWCNFK